VSARDEAPAAPSAPPIDAAKEVRAGEELDLVRLEPYLRQHLPAWDGPLTLTQFPGGHSNLTYLLQLGERKVVLRRPPFGSKVKTAHDMGREHRILSRLPDVYRKAPRALLYCDDLAVIGAPFYLMERVEGVVLRGTRPKGVVLDEATMRQISENTVDGLAELHAVDYGAAGLGDLGHPEGYVARQVTGWSERYAKSRTDDIAEMDKAARWLADHQPRQEPTATLIHNDFKYDNLVLDPRRLAEIRAVLDWEMATVGDPLMDLGTTLGYWIDPDDPEPMRLLPFGPATLPGNLTRRQVVERYAKTTGRDVGDLLFYYVYATFKVAVIAQQIYYRYKQGLTQDERFAAMITGVQILSYQAARAIELGRFDRLG
jgi:aminoglycoside phosphotransferase (APT) family kinase protein